MSAEADRTRGAMRYHERRAQFFAGKSCARCGAEEDLQVHHRDPSQKVTHRIWSWSTARREAELAKCEVLCAPCHREHHSEERRRPENLKPCGTTAAYDRGCRCDDCLEARAERGREERQRLEREGRRGHGHSSRSPAPPTRPRQAPALTRQQIVDVLASLGALHTAEVAEEIDRPLPTVYAHLTRLEREGLVTGIKHDERRIFYRGRIRIYWSLRERADG